MHRAWQRFLTSVVFTVPVIVAIPRVAEAYHSGSTFDKPAGAGGGGGIFYAGAKLEKGWDCNMCHLDAPGQVKVRLDVDPPALFQGFSYTPGEAYSFTATMVGEHLGKSSPLSNYNSVVVEIVDAKGFQAGSIGGFAAEDLYAGYPATVVTTGTKPNVTQWKFTWTAPVLGSGGVTMHIAAVDGNGADAGAGKTLTDPLHDDVFVSAVAFAETPMGRRNPTGTGAIACAMGLVLAVGSTKRRPRKNS